MSTARVDRLVGSPKIKTNRKLEQKYVLQRMCKSVRNLSKEAAVYFGTKRVCALCFFLRNIPAHAFIVTSLISLCWNAPGIDRIPHVFPITTKAFLRRPRNHSRGLLDHCNSEIFNFVEMFPCFVEVGAPVEVNKV